MALTNRERTERRRILAQMLPPLGPAPKDSFPARRDELALQRDYAAHAERLRVKAIREGLEVPPKIDGWPGSYAWPHRFSIERIA